MFSALYFLFLFLFLECYLRNHSVVGAVCNGTGRVVFRSTRRRSLVAGCAHVVIRFLDDEAYLIVLETDRFHCSLFFFGCFRLVSTGGDDGRSEIISQNKVGIGSAGLVLGFERCEYLLTGWLNRSVDAWVDGWSSGWRDRGWSDLIFGVCQASLTKLDGNQTGIRPQSSRALRFCLFVCLSFDTFDVVSAVVGVAVVRVSGIEFDYDLIGRFKRVAIMWTFFQTDWNIL